MRAYLLAIPLLLLSAGCSARLEDGAPIHITDIQEGFPEVLDAALARAQAGKLTKPIVVLDSSPEHATTPVPLFEISWSSEHQHRFDDADTLLDKANIRLLHKDGSLAPYNYCFIENHAQVATHFCTETLITEMKARVGRDIPKPAL